MTAIGIWSLTVTPGEPKTFSLAGDVKITNVSLTETLSDPNGRSVIKFFFDEPVADADDDDEDADSTSPPKTAVVLCSLTGGKTEQTTVELILQEHDEYKFEVLGKNAVHILGNYIDQTSNVPYNPMDDSDLDSDEEAYDLDDVSSDVEMEMDPAEVDSDGEDADRFEEVTEETEKKVVAPVAAGTKRPIDSVSESPKLSKAERKAMKKLKVEDGKSAAPPQAATNGDAKSSEDKKDKKDKKEKKEKEKKEGQAQTIAGGLKFTDAKVGDGPKAKKGDFVEMRYIGKLTSGKQFDANTKGKPFGFRLGKGEVIKGWDEGIVGMQAGGERQLHIPAAMGYGKKGTDGIPGNSDLLFEVKLLKIR